MENNKSNQWELEGNCNICRRKNYCSKPCTRSKRARKALMKEMATSYLDKMTGGAYSDIIDRTGRDYFDYL